MAPEVHLSHRYGPAADVYAFTVSIWEIVHRKMPYYDLERELMATFFTEVALNGRRPIIEEGFEVDTEMRELLQRGWDADPAKRITINEIINYARQKISQGDGKTKQQKIMEKALEDQRRNQEKQKKKAELDWLEDKRTILMVRRERDTQELLILDRETSQWKTSSLQLPQAVGDCGMICLEQEIYIFGGDLWDQTFKLNKEMKWDRMADMNEKRSNISNSFLLFDDCIWVFGGQNRSKKDLNSVEKHIPSENEWIKMPPMNQKRKGAAAAVCGGKIYVCGGNLGDGDSFEALKSVECFDPKEEVWTKFVDLPTPAWGMGVISDGGCLIICGGAAPKITFKNVWKINLNDANRKWKELPSMKETRYFLTVQSIEKKIFAIGGHDNKSVEIFDGTSWERGPELPEICWAVSSVVIPHPLAAKLIPKIEKTEKFLEEQRILIEKLSERLAWLEEKRTILMVRGIGETKELLILDRETSQWKTSAVELPGTGGSCGMICLEQEIYIFGGGLFNKTFKLNKKMTWDRMGDMNEGRRSISNSFLLFDGCIWVFGGKNQSDLNSVEKYNPRKNKWIKKPPMDQKRRCAAAAACGGKIYVCGGNFGDGDSVKALKSVECFDPKEEVWTKFVDLPNPAWGIGVISDGGCLFIIGGSNGISFKNVWKINPNAANSTWKELPSTKERRYFLTVQSVGKRIFAIGGRNNKSVEIFDGTSWQYGPELPEICWGVASVVIPHSLAAKLLPM